MVLNQVATQRLDALTGLLGGYMDAIGAGTHVEAFKLVDNARLEMRLAQRLAKLTTGTPVDGQLHIYMLMLQR